MRFIYADLLLTAAIQNASYLIHQAYIYNSA